MRITALFITAAAAVVLSLFPAVAAEKKSPSEEEFCRLDRSNDRELSFEEFAACEFYKLEHLKRLPYADLKTFDRDQKGFLTDDERKAYLFDRADKNKDRKIGRKEWEEFYDSLMDRR